MSMLAERRRRIVIEQAIDAPDGAGGVVRMWQAQADVWASFKMARGAERDRNERRALTRVWNVRMRWRDDIDGMRRLRDGDRIFSVLNAGDPDGRGAWLKLTVEEETP